jgi:hypothetical protein
MAIEFEVNKTVRVQAKELRIYSKMSDSFSATLHDQDGQEICSQDRDYVPDFMPGSHYGDYLILNIDLETGTITNWEPPLASEISDWVANCKQREVKR